MSYAEEIMGDYQFGFQCNILTTDQIFRINQILKKNWEYNGAVPQSFIDLKKACLSQETSIVHYSH
jgi:hypothetical protein